MALSRLDSLYMAVVSDHSKNPHHHGRLDGVEAVQLNNPICGDVISLAVKFDGDIIEDIAFSGHGCTISTASSSMMTDAVIGKSKADALELAEIFSIMVQGKTDERQEELGDASFMAGVSKFPQRIKCATLSWNALKKSIERSEM
ncbi:SUF system NifU family Fe-S cluster assembly protein [Streptococcus sp. X16XC17]|uniref:Fe-S cluster assembly sulfur transfer protein SufU n=1 Tax=unclassified Streptococcus TaxID=2608887 RepID=UPI00066FD3A3|nr:MULTISPECIES: SUF system NifU family Fe-S cluster assembly protein [unclassified Streptococcus]TCD45592.1 SUF system NifU family Fe-S cluster assembly protein [Streptococcus sp. X16XC17]